MGKCFAAGRLDIGPHRPHPAIMRAPIRLLFLLCLTLLPLALPARAGQRPGFPFAPGERLTYAISWTVVPAGTAVLEVLPVERRPEGPVLRFRGQARSNSFVDAFYKVRTTIESETDYGLTRSLSFHSDQNEGRYHKDARVEFNWLLSRAVRTIRGEVRHELFIWPPQAFDPLSMLFYFRTRPLIQGMDFEGPVTDGKKFVRGRAEVGGIETVRTEAGEFRCFRVEPKVSEVGGVFQKSPGARLVIWISADERRLPVKVRSEVAVGHFTLELTRVEDLGPGWNE